MHQRRTRTEFWCIDSVDLRGSLGEPVWVGLVHWAARKLRHQQHGHAVAYVLAG